MSIKNKKNKESNNNFLLSLNFASSFFSPPSCFSVLSHFPPIRERVLMYCIYIYIYMQLPRSKSVVPVFDFGGVKSPYCFLITRFGAEKDTGCVSLTNKF